MYNEKDIKKELINLINESINKIFNEIDYKYLKEYILYDNICLLYKLENEILNENDLLEIKEIIKEIIIKKVLLINLNEKINLYNELFINKYELIYLENTNYLNYLNENELNIKLIKLIFENISLFENFIEYLYMNYKI